MLTSRWNEHGPTKMHLLRDIMIADGAILARRSYDRIAPGERRWFLDGEFDRPSESVLCSTFYTQKYFGHWLRESTSSELLAHDLGLPALVLEGATRIHEPAYRQILSLNPRRTKFAYCDRLWLLDDTERNPHWLDRYERLRKRVRSHVKAPSAGTDRVFLARGNCAQGRALINRSEVRSELSRRGWIILEPEKENVRTIARTLSRARIVVSPEGSALAHATIAVPRGAGILTIIGAQNFNIQLKTLCDALGVRFGLTIADPVNDTDYSQPIDRLLRAIDLLETAIDKS